MEGFFKASDWVGFTVEPLRNITTERWAKQEADRLEGPRWKIVQSIFSYLKEVELYTIIFQSQLVREGYQRNIIFL